jgi:hypothetical protein
MVPALALSLPSRSSEVGSASLMVETQKLRRLLPILALAFLGCQPKIGDDCVTDLDCSQSGDRICDTTQPDGYCTQVDCDPSSCPEKESICISFNDALSTVGVCNSRGQVSPYRRTFCMGVCEGSGDCRKGYSCMDLSKPNDWGAEVIQKKPETTKVCVLNMSYAPIEETRSDQVCSGSSSKGASAIGGAGGMAAD